MKLQKEIKINSRIIIVMILVIVIIIGISSSYALFQTSVKLDNVVKIETSDKLNLDNSGLNFPSPLPNTVPIYSKDNKIYKADSNNLDKNNQWYNYRNKMIANAVTVQEGKERFVSGEYKNILDTRHYTILDDGNLYLDGYDDFYNLGHANVDFGKNISMVLRFKVNSGIETSPIFLDNGFSGHGISFNQVSDKFRFQILGVNSLDVNILNNQINEWHTVVGTYNGSNMILYDNGIEVGRKALSTAINISEAPFILGGNVGGNNGNPNGDMANITVSNVLVYTDTLTASEVSTYFNDEITSYPEDNVLINVGKGNFEIIQKYYTITDNDELYLKGGNNFLTLGHDQEEFSNNKISMIARVKFHENGLNKSQEFFGNWESGGGGLGCNSEDKIYFTYYIGDAYQNSSSNQKCEIETWYTIVGVYDGSYEHIYINGEESADPIAITGNIKTSQAPFMLGNNPKAYKLGAGVSDTKDSVNITISDIFVYKDAISKEEVVKYFQGEIKDYPKDNILINYRGFKEAKDREIYLNSEAGIEIKSEDITGTLKWIPRYSLIENKIRFEWKTRNQETRNQAFSYNNKELLGYWVTKDNNIELGNLDVSKYNLHSITENEKSALTNLYSYWNKGESEGYIKSISVSGD